jgi:hypothetical protein
VALHQFFFAMHKIDMMFVYRLWVR